MDIFETLNEIKDCRHEGGLCDFQGYLEDFLDNASEDLVGLEVLKEFFKLNNDFKIIHNLKIEISQTSISNQIIRYKDISKLGKYPLKIKYILYTRNEESSKAIILDQEFIYAKALFYVLSEEPSPFNSLRHDILISDLALDAQTINDIVSDLFKLRTGSIQKRIDLKHFENYDQAFERVLELSSNIEKDLNEFIASPELGGSAKINHAVCCWYLLKKFSYVQYMINKQILKERHQDNIKLQRNQAKINADKVRFMPLSNFWQAKKQHSNQN